MPRPAYTLGSALYQFSEFGQSLGMQAQKVGLPLTSLPLKETLMVPPLLKKPEDPSRGCWRSDDPSRVLDALEQPN
ncbi:hypothetical protein J4Q44_G00107600 [Coregonus suidteri]|uniref:Uncharacterized protein n=1 Tax=Coregonus suidteri TaxID=861788 RepID=A0AAN8QY25_9TELE